jgi:hypothetical protein
MWVLDSLIIVYIQFLIMLTELREALSLELKCLCSKTTTVLLELYQKLKMRVSYIFIALEINKYTVHKCIHTVYTAHMYSTGPYVH